jgi:hypothetical protein
MKVEIYTTKGWEEFLHTTCVEGDAPGAYVVYAEVGPGVHMKSLDGQRLRIDGVESVNVWGRSLSAGTLTLDVLT